MKIKTSEAKDQVLDYLVAQCEGIETKNYSGALTIRYDGDWWQPSIDWAQGGPIIERERIAVWGDNDLYWEAECGWAWAKGPTPLVAAMRAYVALKLGEEVEALNELA